jgi:hypothetical protein
LNQLSVAIGADKEDAWEGWLCDHPETGKRVKVSALRDPTTIRKKAKPALSAADMGWQ